MDIYAICPTSENGTIVCLSIECKKIGEKKLWAIIPRRKYPTIKEYYPFLTWSKEAGIEYFTRLILPDLNYKRSDDFECGIAHKAFIEKNDVDDDNNNKSFDQHSIYKALRQANEPINALISDPHYYIFNKIHSDPRKVLFLPIVVTTARLALYKFNTEDVDIKTGEVDITKAQMEDKKWIHYEFPLPTTYRVGTKATPRSEKRPTFIVKAEHFSEFLDNFIKNTSDYLTIDTEY